MPSWPQIRRLRVTLGFGLCGALLIACAPSSTDLTPSETSGRPVLTTTAFWQVIDQARLGAGRSASQEQLAERVADRLADKTPDQIVQFDVILDGLLDESYRWDLWGAAYVINGGCSEDCFDYFRGWLIIQGRPVWDAALADPDSLAAVVSQGTIAESEDMLNAPVIAYRRATGKSDGFWDAVQTREASVHPADENAGNDPTDQNADESTAHQNAANSTANHDAGNSTADQDAGNGTADEPAGAQFDFEDSTLMADHFPRLSALNLN